MKSDNSTSPGDSDIIVLLGLQTVGNIVSHLIGRWPHYPLETGRAREISDACTIIR